MSKLFLGACALVGAGIVVYACFVIFKADLPTAQHNSIIIGCLVVASVFVIVWGFADWVRRGQRVNYDHLATAVLAANEAALEEGFAIGYEAAARSTPKPVPALHLRRRSLTHE